MKAPRQLLKGAAFVLACGLALSGLCVGAEQKSSETLSPTSALSSAPSSAATVTTSKDPSYTPPLTVKGETPLAYIRLPFPWQLRDALTNDQQERMIRSVFSAPITRAALRQSLSDVLSSTVGPLEILLLPTDNKMLITPHVILSARHHAKNPEVLANALVELVKEAHFATGKYRDNMDWVRAKSTKKGDSIVKTVFLAQYFHHIEVGADYYRLVLTSKSHYFENLTLEESQPAPKRAWAKESAVQDAVFYVNAGALMSLYGEWAQREARDLYEVLNKNGLLTLDHVEAYTSGKALSFAMKLNMEFKDKLPWPWSDLFEKSKEAQKNKAFQLSAGEFGGTLRLAELSPAAFTSLFRYLAPTQSLKSPMYARLWQQVGSALSFTWPDAAPAPVLFIALKNTELFEKELANLIGPYAEMTGESEDGRKFTTLRFKTGLVLSYELRNEGLLFSPMRQALIDFKGELKEIALGPIAHVDYPLASTDKKLYYTTLNIVQNTWVALFGSVDSNAFLPWSRLNSSDTPWSGEGKLELDTSNKSMSLVWQQPSGVPGLLAGLRGDSGQAFQFLSLLHLTWKSF